MKYQNLSIPDQILTDPMTQRMESYQYQIYACRQTFQNRVRQLHNVLLPYIKLAVILDGECAVTIQNRQFIGRAGDGFLVPPYFLHSARFVTDRLETFEVLFQVRGRLNQEGWLTAFGRQLCFPRLCDAAKRQFCRDLFIQVEQEKPGSILQLQHWIGEQACSMLQTTENQPLGLAPKAALFSTAEQFCTMLEQSQDQLNVQDYCRRLHVSQSYLCRCTLEIIRLSPSELIIQHRLTRALRLLADPEYSIRQIAELLHYQNASYFTLQFRRTFSSTPSEYRKLLRR